MSATMARLNHTAPLAELLGLICPNVHPSMLTNGLPVSLLGYPQFASNIKPLIDNAMALQANPEQSRCLRA